MFFILNNKQLGMIMQEQKVEGYPNWQTELYDYDFADYAEHSGGTGIKVEEPNELERAVDKRSSEKPVILTLTLIQGDSCKAFLVAFFFELNVVWNCRSERRNAFRVGFRTNKSLFLAIITSVFTTLAVVYIAPLPAMFQNAPLDLTEWALVISLSSSGFLVVP
jgi:hypothetical protein